MSKLYIVSTPIGNLSDITFRAVETLKSVDLIACEDTRTSKKLLNRYDIQTRLVSYHQHSKQPKLDFIVEELRAGKDIAVITDAGTPGISDPGGKLIEEVVKKNGSEVEVLTIPGPSAVIAALSISGFPVDKFLFLGFMPHKKGRETFIKRIVDSSETVAFYESTHRIMKTLDQMRDKIGARNIMVGRELTKKFESTYRGTVDEVISQLEESSTKGEFVIVINNK
jgi:16S rRNA (cytidine1402-2'-O)-methyltransferase